MIPTFGRSYVRNTVFYYSIMAFLVFVSPNTRAANEEFPITPNVKVETEVLSGGLRVSLSNSGFIDFADRKAGSVRCLLVLKFQPGPPVEGSEPVYSRSQSLTDMVPDGSITIPKKDGDTAHVITVTFPWELLKLKEEQARQWPWKVDAPCVDLQDGELFPR